MSIEAKKEQLVDYLKGIQDEKLLDKISSYVTSLVEEEAMFVPMIEEELEERLAISRKDYEEGRYYTQE
ncbi:hypothetical protein HX017_13415 [Myroides marinus]|uniref:Uncharacterized protein n=1 Tax=Myroides marinus TaxID=703342 RepID=A0A164AI64_9FLAO|nr:hypothetical protein [Myroides marinus]KUF40355.1 hypothetical protein AS361_17205 [Myroides marinus]KZE83904.1 hypothetical protein AV926_03090 [Myroides marinus]MDM1348120.1 hypothetical protein [Myroides marinus]MDM1351705.1 hypothetical protein [Myroides marinus]MDM1354628.1 hypothetical protein [Myroides marinus]